jgi:DNA mismatch repair protein MutS2
MLRHADPRSLILIDEFGGGTEPQIGGAIAESILDRLAHTNQAWGVITTHYQNLKHYADSHPRLANGAMLYDRARMEPLFRLAIGQPGSSFAIEIARKTGLPDEIIRKASDIVGQDYVNADKYVQDIVRDKLYWEEKRKQIRQQEKQMQQSMEAYQTKLAALKADKKTIMDEARQQAQQLLATSNAQVERTIRIIKESKADKQTTQIARKKLDTFKQQVAPVGAGLAPAQHHPTPTVGTAAQPLAQHRSTPSTSLQVGAYVRIKGQTVVGQVEKLTPKTATVIFGSIKTRVKTTQLEVTAQPPRTSAPKTDAATLIGAQSLDRLRERKLHFKPEIDVRGLRGDEAIAKVVDFLDDALQTGMQRVRILHGTGNGILRTLIREYLSSLPYVQSYQDEHIQLGGSGITVIDMQ